MKQRAKKGDPIKSFKPEDRKRIEYKYCINLTKDQVNPAYDDYFFWRCQMQAFRMTYFHKE